jgi:hypothetical protein
MENAICTIFSEKKDKILTMSDHLEGNHTAIFWENPIRSDI